MRRRWGWPSKPMPNMSQTSRSYQLADGQRSVTVGTDGYSPCRATLTRTSVVAVEREQVVDDGEIARRLAVRGVCAAARRWPSGRRASGRAAPPRASDSAGPSRTLFAAAPRPWGCRRGVGCDVKPAVGRTVPLARSLATIVLARLRSCAGWSSLDLVRRSQECRPAACSARFRSRMRAASAAGTTPCGPTTQLSGRFSLPTASLQQQQPLHERVRAGRAARHVDVHRQELVHALDDAVDVVHPAGVRARAHRDHPARLHHLLVEPLDHRRHLDEHRARR